MIAQRAYYSHNIKMSSITSNASERGVPTTATGHIETREHSPSPRNQT